MSRSYKKYPATKCEKSCKYGKKLANKRVRKMLREIPNGRAYKKLYDTWNICDFKHVYFKSTCNECEIKYKRK